MIRIISLGSIVLLTILFMNVPTGPARAQNIGASLPEVKGRAGRQVVVDLVLTGNTLAAQAGINMLYNPDVVSIVEVGFDVFPGPDFDGGNFFLIRGVKDTSVQNPVNSMGLFMGIFTSTFPASIIPNGAIVTIIFTISDDAEPGDFSELEFSFLNNVPSNPTSFAAQDGTIVAFEQSSFTNGRITVARAGGGGSCALAAGPLNSGQIVGILIILFIPVGIAGYKLLRRRGLSS